MINRYQGNSGKVSRYAEPGEPGHGSRGSGQSPPPRKEKPREQSLRSPNILGSLEDLGKGLRSQGGTMFASNAKGPRYLEMAEGYCTRMALNKDNEVIGYEFVHLGKMMAAIAKGTDANEALKAATGHYGQWDAAVKYIDPRHE